MDFDVKENNFEKSYMPEGKFIGIITKVEIKKKHKHYAVMVSVVIWNGKIFKTFKKEYKKIFTNGREVFQNFCEDFDLIVNNNDAFRLELENAIGCYCYATFNDYNGFDEIIPAEENKTGNLDPVKIFSNTPLYWDIDNIPDCIKNYRFFLGYEEEYCYDMPHPGIIRNCRIMPDRNNCNYETLCITVSVLNGCQIKNFCYYLNGINEYSSYDYFLLAEDFGIIDDDNNVDIYALTGNLCLVEIYEATTGRKYIRSIKPFCSDDKYEEKQYQLWAKAYNRYLTQNELGIEFDEM